MSKKATNLKMLGEYISSAYELDPKFWKTFLKDYKDLLRQDSQMLVGIYAAAKFCGAAEKYKQAAGFSQVLVNKLGYKYPPAYLITAKYYRLNGNYNEALNVAELASHMEGIQKQLKEEKARITEGARKAEKARKNK